MLRAIADIVLPTTIVGSLPRRSWYLESLGSRNFLAAMVNARCREQYIDTLSAYMTEQQLAGLDIVIDGDRRFTLVLGTNIVRRELGLPEAPCPAADGRYSLVVPVQ
ncbi:MAG: hypothetical protein IT537_27745 [Hyphomicrobiales bacterium]|nr:hypothetical protein [Hyphomicrobiales bacterium]